MVEEPGLESKELVLFVFGTIIMVVLMHGLWVAWRKSRQKLRFDFVEGASSPEVDEIELLRGELPNGGARLVDVLGQQTRDNKDRVDPEMGRPNQDLDLFPPTLESDKVVDSNIEILTQEQLDFSDPKKERIESKGYALAKKKVLSSLEKVGQIGFKESQPADISHEGVDGFKIKEEFEQQVIDDPTSQAGEVLELIVLNVLAPTGTVYHGRSLVEAMQSQGLKYGDMNIFHRIDQQNKSTLFSVANALEPGTFDLSDLETVQSSGVTFFMQLPAPNDASIIFDLMLNTARNLVLELGGSLKDEQLSVLTGQTVEHMRQRIADFSRRRMSARA